jgi:hypothetical protein
MADRHTARPRVIRAGYLSTDGKVILVAIGPDNRERYKAHAPAGDERQIALVSELMWRETESTFPGVVTPPASFGCHAQGRAAPPPLVLVRLDDEQDSTTVREMTG